MDDRFLGKWTRLKILKPRGEREMAQKRQRFDVNVSQRFRDIDTKYFWYIERNKKKEEDKFPWTVFQFG